MASSRLARLFLHLFASLCAVVIISGVQPLFSGNAESNYSAEIDTKNTADRVQRDLIQAGVTAQSIENADRFLSAAHPFELLVKDYEPPVIDPWGVPFRVAHRAFMFDEMVVDFGVYSFGPDGKSESNGNDADDISAWADCDNDYWRRVHQRSNVRRWTWRLGLSFVVGVSTFLVSLTRGIRKHHTGQHTPTS